MNRDATNLAKIQAEYHKNGLLGIVEKIKIKVFTFIFYTTISKWYECNLAEPVVDFTPDIELDTDFLVHEKNHLIDWLQNNKTKFTWIYFEKEIDAALKYDHIFYTMLHQGLLIGYIKIGIGKVYIHDFDQTVIFPPGIAFIYDIFILPEYRGKNLSSHALNQTIRYLRNENFTGVFCHIEDWNKPSIKSFQKCGFLAWGSIRFVRMAFFSLFLKNRWWPFLNLERHIRKTLPVWSRLR